jgi:hypothetical protein
MSKLFNNIFKQNFCLFLTINNLILIIKKSEEKLEIKNVK